MNANKISLNASKTKVLIFRHQNKPIMYRKKSGDKLKPWDIKIKIDGNKLEPTTHVKYLGILIDSHLNWKFYIDDLSIKLSHTVGMLAKIRHYVTQRTLNMVSSLLYYFMDLKYGTKVIHPSQKWRNCKTKH